MKALNILVVDDNPDDRELCSRALEKSGTNFHILEASNGSTAEKTISNEAIDCILLDYSLPGKNGIEVLNTIRAKYPNVPTIMLTGQGNETIAVEAMKHGAQDYIVKANITSQSLIHLITKAIEKCEMQHHLETRRSALALFTRALAHDLREPVRTIRSFIELALKDSLSENLTFLLERIATAAANMEKLIHSVRDYTELVGLADIERTNCSVKDVLNGVLVSLNDQISDSGAKITVQEHLPLIQANEGLLAELFQNLIGNAIKFSDKDPPLVRIGTQEGPNGTEFFVQDNGPGIERKNWELIFEPFKRFSSKKGTGLGLAICKKIIETHGGKIGCTSTLGEGTRFYFTLHPSPSKIEENQITPEGMNSLLNEAPHLQTAADSNLRSSEKVAKNRHSGLANVLVVDDSADDIFLLKSALLGKKKLRFNLHFVNNGQEAINFLENKTNPKIDLILLDISMPILDGFEFLEYMKAKNLLQNQVIIVCSSSDSESDKKTANRLGANGYLVKPVNRKTVEEGVRKTGGFLLTIDTDGTVEIMRISTTK